VTELRNPNRVPAEEACRVLAGQCTSSEEIAKIKKRKARRMQENRDKAAK
jgi:hypothetical protein